MVMIVKAAFAVVVAAVAIVVARFITTFIIVACRAIGSRNMGDVIPMAKIGLFSISILIGHLEHLIDHLRWLPVDLSIELVMAIQPADEGRDNLSFEDGQ